MRGRLLVFALLIASLPMQGSGLAPFVRGSWQQIRQAHGRQPLVVHFWGITCAPCMAELPKWGQLERERPKARLVFVAADPVAVEPSQIAAAMAKARIGLGETWMFDDAFGDRLRYEVNPSWAGELPYTVMIDRDGHPTFTSGVMDLKVVRAWLDKASGPTSNAKP